MGSLLTTAGCAPRVRALLLGIVAGACATVSACGPTGASAGAGPSHGSAATSSAAGGTRGTLSVAYLGQAQAVGAASTMQQVDQAFSGAAAGGAEGAASRQLIVYTTANCG